MADDINISLGTTEVIWKLADLYNGYDDAQIEEDIQQCEKEASALNKQFSGKVAGLSSEELNEAVKRFEQLSIVLGRLSTFAFLNFATNTHDQQVSGFLQRMREMRASAQG